MSHLEYLIKQAAILIVDGKATIENAFQMAIEEDNARLSQCIEDTDCELTNRRCSFHRWRGVTSHTAKIVYHKINNADESVH